MSFGWIIRTSRGLAVPATLSPSRQRRRLFQQSRTLRKKSELFAGLALACIFIGAPVAGFLTSPPFWPVALPGALLGGIALHLHDKSHDAMRAIAKLRYPRQKPPA